LIAQFRRASLLKMSPQRSKNLVQREKTRL
jgi:hypothetical protein